MLRDRDFLIFFLLLIGVVLLNIIPMPSQLRIAFFIILVIMQVLFIYNGLRRGR